MLDQIARLSAEAIEFIFRRQHQAMIDDLIVVRFNLVVQNNRRS